MLSKLKKLNEKMKQNPAACYAWSAGVAFGMGCMYFSMSRNGDLGDVLCVLTQEQAQALIDNPMDSLVRFAETGHETINVTVGQ